MLTRTAGLPATPRPDVDRSRTGRPGPSHAAVPPGLADGEIRPQARVPVRAEVTDLRVYPGDTTSGRNSGHLRLAGRPQFRIKHCFIIV